MHHLVTPLLKPHPLLSSVLFAEGRVFLFFEFMMPEVEIKQPVAAVDELLLSPTSIQPPNSSLPHTAVLEAIPGDMERTLSPLTKPTTLPTEADITAAPKVQDISAAGMVEQPVASRAADTSTLEALSRQIHFYFSEANLVRDKFMRKELELYNNVFPIATLLNFNRYARLLPINE